MTSARAYQVGRCGQLAPCPISPHGGHGVASGERDGGTQPAHRKASSGRRSRLHKHCSQSFIRPARVAWEQRQSLCPALQRACKHDKEGYAHRQQAGTAEWAPGWRCPDPGPVARGPSNSVTTTLQCFGWQSEEMPSAYASSVERQMVMQHEKRRVVALCLLSNPSAHTGCRATGAWLWQTAWPVATVLPWMLRADSTAHV